MTTPKKMPGREMWLSQTGGTATVSCAMHSAEHLEKCNYSKGHFFTPFELLEFTRMVVERARETVKHEEWDEWRHESAEEILKELEDGK